MDWGGLSLTIFGYAAYIAVPVACLAAAWRLRRRPRLAGGLFMLGAALLLYWLAAAILGAACEFWGRCV